MLINKNIVLFNEKLHLVPYSRHHVPKYHEWMQDPDIQVATASEPLTLEEEYSMQRSWRTDADKLTFIICRAPTTAQVHEEQASEIEAMIGDVNMFSSVVEHDDDNKYLVAELELMIARHQDQGKGYGRTALLLFLSYVINHETEVVQEFYRGHDKLRQKERFDYFAVKIGEANHRSIALFRGLGFEKTSESPNYFGEFELRCFDMDKGKLGELMERYGIGSYGKGHYNGNDE